MSIFNRYYSARIAPCSSSWREAIYNGVEVVDEGELWAESFAADAFLPNPQPVPVVLSHAEDEVVGQVMARATHNGWHIADFVLDHSKTLSAVALDLLKVGAPVSIGAQSLRHDNILARDRIMRHTIARFQELSILRPNEKPAYPGAQITAIYEMPMRRSEPVVGGETVIYGDGTPLRRYFGNVPMTVR